MKEENVVYEALRSHILQKEYQISNETIYMYVTYFALLAVGKIWDGWFSLVSFFCLIVFQSMINSDQWAIEKASIYIRIFFEEQCQSKHWESLSKDSFCLAVLNGKISRTIGWYISRWGSTILSFLSLLAILIPILHKADYNLGNISSVMTVRIFIAAVLCVIVIFVNKQYFSTRNGTQASIDLEKAIRAFYEKSQNK